MCTISNNHGRITETKNDGKSHMGVTKWFYIYIFTIFSLYNLVPVPTARVFWSGSRVMLVRLGHPDGTEFIFKIVLAY